MGKQKVVLAFSGGLDTSFCVKYLSEDKGYDVYTAIANTGGFSKEELANIEKRALALGAVKHATLDIEQEYYEKSIKYMIYGDILRNVTGTVELILRPYSYTLVGVDSTFDLMKTDFGEYGEVNKAWTADDVKGFTKILGNQIKIYHNVQKRNKK